MAEMENVMEKATETVTKVAEKAGEHLKDGDHLLVHIDNRYVFIGAVAAGVTTLAVNWAVKKVVKLVKNRKKKYHEVKRNGSEEAETEAEVVDTKPDENEPEEK